MDFLSHISFSVSDFKKSLAFYDAVLGALGHSRVYTSETGAGWGPKVNEEKFEIKKRVEKVVTPSAGFHLAFHAKTKEDLHAAYNEAMKFGGKDNGAPGPRPNYGTDYYACFFLDPDGYEIEIKVTATWQ